MSDKYIIIKGSLSETLISQIENEDNISVKDWDLFTGNFNVGGIFNFNFDSLEKLDTELKEEGIQFYISIHPGGGNTSYIKSKLSNINKLLQVKYRIFNVLITYHGSQNVKAYRYIESNLGNIVSFKHHLKQFINPDLESELNNNQECLLLQKNIVKEFIDDESLRSNVFIEGAGSKKQLKAYINQIEGLCNKGKELLDSLSPSSEES